MGDNESELSVEQQVIRVFTEKLNFVNESIIKHNRSVPLTWEPFNFSAVQLIYLFLEIEKNFSIHIPEKYLHDYGFNSVDQIIIIVNECTDRISHNLYESKKQ